MSEKQTQSKSTWKNLLAGGLAGGAEAAIMYPTEYVKTQLQLQAKAAKTGAAPKYNGIFDCAVKVIKEKGPFALYRGVSTLVVGAIPKAGIRFAAFNFFKSQLEENGKMTPTRNMLAGLGAGVAEAVFAVTPAETVKTKMIHDQNSANPKYRGLVHGVSTMVKEEGLKGIYKGVTPTMLKQGCNQACRFTIYELAKNLISGGDAKYKMKSYESMLAGGVAGAISVYATMPFDVIKTRMQGLEASQYGNSLECFKKILTNEGVLAFWKGTIPRLSRVMFSGGIIFTCYEQIMPAILYFFPDTK